MSDDIMALVGCEGRLIVKVTPNAGKNEIFMPTEASESLHLLVRVTATAEDGKANATVLKLLSKALGIPKSSLTIVRGSKSRTKAIQIPR